MERPNIVPNKNFISFIVGRPIVFHRLINVISALHKGVRLVIFYFYLYLASDENLGQF